MSATQNFVEVTRSKEHSHITTTNQGGTGRDYEEILDLAPATDVEYELRDVGLRIILELQDSSGAELTDDATLRWVGQGPLEDAGDTQVLTREYRYGEFSNANLRNQNEEVVFEFVVSPEDLRDGITFREGGHLKLEMKHNTDVDWSSSSIEFEVFRRVTS